MSNVYKGGLKILWPLVYNIQWNDCTFLTQLFNPKELEFQTDQTLPCFSVIFVALSLSLSLSLRVTDDDKPFLCPW